MPTFEELQQRAAEKRRARGVTTSRMSTSTGGSPAQGGVASRMAPAPDAPSGLSRFASAAAGTFRRAVPQEVRDVAGNTVQTLLSGEKTINFLTQSDLGTRGRRQQAPLPTYGGPGYRGRSASES